MKPRTLSASSLETAIGCLARYKAENIDFVPRTGNQSAANIGTAVHGALEMFVKQSKMEEALPWDLKELIDLYRLSYAQTFKSGDENTDEFRDGLGLIKTWFKRTDLSDVVVMSVETKTRYPINTSIGQIPFTYIWDRCDWYTDAQGRKVIKVVDYKTIRADLGPDDLRAKLQARVYALFASIQFKGQYDRIVIEFDLLRHEPVAVSFSRDDIKQIWEMIHAEAERIVDASEIDPPETLNSGCGWCVRKASCITLNKNVEGGGTFALMDMDKLLKKSEEIDAKMRGMKNLKEELDAALLAFARENDTFSWETKDMKVKTTSRSYRSIDGLELFRIVGGEIFATYGKINIGDVDKILADPSVSDEDKTAIQAAIVKAKGRPIFKVERK